MGEARPRLEGLDGLRGVAALAVVIWHVNLYDLIGAKPFDTHAYLAVDLFFVISGFILGEVYGPRLARGEGVGWFMRARFNRLLPLYLLGACLGLAAFALAKPEAAGIGGAGLSILLVLALLFLPWMFGGAAHLAAFPLNPPSWSLSLELWGNLIYAAVAPRLSNRILAGLVATGAAILVGVAVFGDGLNLGWRQGDLWVGWARFLFAFSTGLGLRRLRANGRLRLPALPDWAPALMLGAVLLAPAIPGPWNKALDLAVVFLVFPALVAGALDVRANTWASGLLRVGARLSYPLYIVHAAVVLLAGWAATSLHAGKPMKAVAGLALSLAVAWAAERWFDRPVRAWIVQRRERIRIARPVAAA